LSVPRWIPAKPDNVGQLSSNRSSGERAEPRRKHMKYVKMLGLAAVAAAALMAFVGASTASATVLCKTKVNAKGNCPKGWGYEGEIHAVSEIEKPTLTGELMNVECKESTVSGNATEGTAVSTETPNGAIAVLSFSTCNCEVIVVEKGTLEVHAKDDLGNGTVTSTGARITINCTTIFGKVHCEYKTNATDIGTLTGSSTTGETATIDITAEIPIIKTDSLCGNLAVWHAKYKITTPDPILDVATATE
jgi:hypothetical protein